MYEAAGTIKLILDTQTFESGFSKREFVVTTDDERYPQDLKFEVVKERCEILDNFQPGQRVNVAFNIRGNEYNGRYYVNLNCWKLEPETANSGSSKPTTQSSNAPARQNSEPDFDDETDDDIPF